MKRHDRAGSRAFSAGALGALLLSIGLTVIPRRRDEFQDERT